MVSYPKLRVIALAIFCLGLAGCDTYTAAPYGVSVDNVVVLKHLAPANVVVALFTAPSEVSMLCRLVGPINLPGDIAPQEYISKALSDELTLAGLTGNPGPAVTLTGTVDKFGFVSMIGFGSWDLGVTVVSSNGGKLSVTSSYKFHASYMGDAGCHNVADAFEPAVQALMKQLVTNPAFPALLKAPAVPIS